jgi:hypothetical protein
MITIFKSIADTDTPFYREVESVLHRIRTGKSRQIIERVRAEFDKDERNRIKKELPAICFSGEFSRREDKCITAHSGLICLDFDGFEDDLQLELKKEELKEDAYTYSVFLSPGGDGLKVLVRIPPDPDRHKSYFNALQKHYDCKQFDVTCKNLSRVCYESYDPEIFINDDSIVWDTLDQPEVMSHVNKVGTIRLTDDMEIIRRLKAWWNKKYGMVSGERNNNVYILAIAMNEFGVPKTSAKLSLAEYAQSDFTTKEIEDTVDSAYRDTSKHSTKFFEDEDKIRDLKTKIKQGVPKKEIRIQLRESNVDDSVIDTIIRDAEEDSFVFWSKNDKGAVSIIHHLFKKFLEDNGFFKYCPDSGKNYVFIRMQDNLIDNTNEEEMKDFVLKYLRGVEDTSVYNYFADKTRFFKEDFLNMVDTFQACFIEDGKECSYLYYRNCAVKVMLEGVEVIDYIDLNGHVWRNQVIDRDFSMTDTDDCDYKKFVANVAGGNGRVDSLRSTIGFLMHGYKSLGYCPAVILNDEVISEHPEGGTGKGLFVRALGYMKKMVMIDGKDFAFEKSFPYQLVSADTQLLIFDDVKKNFEFERLFSIVTEGITLEKKNKDAIKIPFGRSPKIVITTNYAIRGSGNSNNRRRWELEFKQHYSMNYTPENEFGRLLFSDWDAEEWKKFDNYMIGNLRLYLNNGFVRSEFHNLETRKFIAATDHSFYEWTNDIHNNLIVIDGTIKYKGVLFETFVNEFPDYGKFGKTSISQQRFYKWLTEFNRYKYGCDPIEGRDSFGKWIKFVKSES